MIIQNFIYTLDVQCFSNRTKNNNKIELEINFEFCFSPPKQIGKMLVEGINAFNS